MNKKLGPLPIWAWGLIAAAAAYYLYRRNQANASSSSGSPGTTGILDPNAVDPNTGLTYGQEEAAALNSNAAGQAGLGGLGGGVTGSTTDSGAQQTVPPANEFGDFLTFLGEWNQFAQATGFQAGGTVAPPAQSPTATASGATAVTTPAHPPSIVAAANTNPNINQTAPWASSSFFRLTLGQIINTFKSPEATARYLFAKGYRPVGVPAIGVGGGYRYGPNVAGETWKYVGPKGKSQLPRLQYTIGARG